MQNDFFRGRLVQQAHAVLALYEALPHATDAILPLLDAAGAEMHRLCDNELQIRCAWGDDIQLAGLIVLVVDQFRSTALDTFDAPKGAMTCK